MIWELDALKMLANNPTVPGIALRDAITEIERLRAAIVDYWKTGNTETLQEIGCELLKGGE